MGESVNDHPFYDPVLINGSYFDSRPIIEKNILRYVMKQWVTEDAKVTKSFKKKSVIQTFVLLFRPVLL